MISGIALTRISEVWGLYQYKVVLSRPCHDRLILHDDVIKCKWKHFPRNWPFVREFTGPGEFPTQRPVTRSFGVFFDLRLNKRLNKQSWGWWFETLSRPSWRHRNDNGNPRTWKNSLHIEGTPWTVTAVLIHVDHIPMPSFCHSSALNHTCIELPISIHSNRYLLARGFGTVWSLFVNCFFWD